MRRRRRTSAFRPPRSESQGRPIAAATMRSARAARRGGAVGARARNAVHRRAHSALPSVSRRRRVPPADRPTVPGAGRGHEVSAIEVPVPKLVGQSVVVEPDAVRILDRRVFPFERTWVTCRSVEDVAKAIEDMVTQSLGPMFAALGGMVLAARSGQPLADAGRRLVATRP